MKKNILSLAAIAALTTATASAQSAVDAMQISQRDFKGTARFMGMGGAFTALGGDLSAIGLNPGGIGVYRSSEIAATLDIDFQKSQTTNLTSPLTQTKAYCNNFGYVGTIRLGGALQTFSWGVTYNRAASFDRKVSGYQYPVNTSLTNYIAAFTNGTQAADLEFTKNYNPYFDSYNDWLSILAYNSYLINNINGSQTNYQGLFTNGTDSDLDMFVEEKGYVDNYEFTFGGNFNNRVYWGVGIGVNDLRYRRITSYSESMANAQVYADNAAGVTNGNAEYYLDNDKLIKGTGWNLSAGVIVRPIQELRIGAAIHSPTWYNIDESHIGSVDYAYTTATDGTWGDNEYTDNAYFSWKMRTPWKFNVGAAAVLGGKAIISADYERQMYKDMSVSTASYDNWGYINGFNSNEYVNGDIKNYTQNANNFRLGVEFRVTPNFSVRAGYNGQYSSVSSEAANGEIEILTEGTDPSYSLDKTTNYYSAGLGYQIKNFYADATYVHKTAKSTLHPYTSYANVTAPSFDVTENNNSVVLSIGFKF